MDYLNIQRGFFNKFLLPENLDIFKNENDAPDILVYAETRETNKKRHQHSFDYFMRSNLFRNDDIKQIKQHYSYYERFSPTRGAGGLVLLVRKDLPHLVEKPLHDELDLFKIRIGTLNIAAAYIPPKLVTKTDGLERVDDLWDFLEAELAGLENVVLIGDLNAHIGRKEANTDTCGSMALPRRIPDEVPTNSIGRRLLHLSRERDMIIVNGRGPFSDRPTAGKPPTTTLDYALTDQSLFSSITDFDVDHPLGAHSDHARIRISLKGDLVPERVVTEEKGERRGKPFNRALERLVAEEVDKIDYAEILALENASDMQRALIEALGAAHKRAKKRDDSVPFYELEAKLTSNFLLSLDRQLLNAEIKQLLQLPQPKESESDQDLTKKQLKTLNKRLKKVKRKLREQDTAARSNLFRDMARKSVGEVWKLIRGAHAVPLENPVPAAVQFAFLCKVAALEGIVNPSPISPTTILPETPRTPGNHDTLLQPITAEEIEKVIKKASRGKAADEDGIRMETFKCAPAMAYEALADIFNRIVLRGEVIKEWGESMAVLLHKKGSVSDVNNYRGIMIERTTEKIFSLLWSSRLTDWAETNKVLVGTQFGFRPKRSTMDAIFVTNAAINVARREKRNRYLIFVDFTKAFDTVPRERLWNKLERLGIPSPIINAFRWVYGTVRATISTGKGEKSPPIDYRFGVKQGDPLSTLFFILYLNDIVAFLEANGAKGINMGDGTVFSRLLAVLFADDTTLFADSLEDAQKQLDLLLEYTSLNGLEVNVGKTEWMRVGPKKSNEETLKYKGTPLKRTDTFTLLGFLISASGSIQEHRQGRESKMNTAYGVWRRILRDNPGMPKSFALETFNALVAAVGQYGNAMSMEAPKDELVVGKGDRDKVFRRALKVILELPTQTSGATLFAIMDQTSLTARDHIAALKYWATIKQRDPVVQQSYNLLTKDAGNASVSRGNWSYQIRDLLVYYLGEDQGNKTWASGEVSGSYLADTVEKKYRSLNQAEISKSEKLDFWRNTGLSFGRTPFLGLKVPEHQNNLIRLATSTHDLYMEIGRRSNVPICERLCPHGCGDVEDEQHLLFNCKAYDNRRDVLRDKLSLVAEKDWSLNTLIWLLQTPLVTFKSESEQRKRGLEAVATFVSKSFNDRRKILKAKNISLSTICIVSDPSCNVGSGRDN